MRDGAALHQGQPVLTGGAPLDQAQAAMILLHGRGADAASILPLAHEFDRPQVAYLAPQAADNQWYPYRFLVPARQNEPWLSSALSRVDGLVQQIEAAGIAPERTVLLGFSQGACLALEYAARNARRYAGVVGLSGGLIGADGEPRQDRGSLAGAPVFLGCSDMDPHIPTARVHHAADTLRALGGDVTVRLYPNMGHTVNHDEIKFVRDMLAALPDRSGGR